MKIVLASQSPRRRELLAQMGVTFDVIPSNFDEQLDDSRTPEEVAIELALGKAHEVAARYPDALVIGSDTIVELEGTQLEKPKDSEDAKRILTLLSGKKNTVFTSLAVVCLVQEIEVVSAGATDVHFRPYDEVAIDAYIATGDSMDKAGAYGIQSGAAVLIDHIEGDYDTVIGLPTLELSRILHELGVVSSPVVLQSPVPQK